MFKAVPALLAVGALACSSTERGDVGPAGAGGMGAGAGAGGVNANSLIPARVRRLASAEYDASVQALLSTTRTPATGPHFPPDLRQDGFTVNDAQRVDAVIIERLAEAADELAHEAGEDGTLARLAPCFDDDEARCARTFIESFGAKVYRRPLTEEEAEALLTLYAVGAENSTYEAGVAHVLRGLLQSAGFLYLTELGDRESARGGVVPLTAHELASSLSYFLTSAPPDDELFEKASRGALAEPDEREAQARRLFATEPRARDTAVRLVREWLGIDRVADSVKDTLVYPAFEGLKPSIVAESRDFVRSVTFESTGTVAELLGATWTVSSGPLALYRDAGSGPTRGTRTIDRVGILNQAAFLTTYANAFESHPIFRGVAIAKRVICYALDSPASFNIQVVPPLPDPTKTTRQRYGVHAREEICAGCHDIIDPFGFAFEHFDGVGAHRDVENGRPVDSAVRVALELEVDGEYGDSNALAAALARSEAVRDCFARNVFRAGAATGDAAATPGEAEFMEFWRALPEAAAGNIVETLIAYVRSPYFDLRSAP